MRALVVGGTGLLAGEIVDTLVSEGHRPTVLSRGNTARLRPEFLAISVL